MYRLTNTKSNNSDVKNYHSSNEKMYNKYDNYLLWKREEKKKSFNSTVCTISKYHCSPSFSLVKINITYHMRITVIIFVCLLFKQRKQNVLQQQTVQRLYNKLITNNNLFSNEVHGKTDTLFPGNNTTAAKLEPLTIRSGGSSSNH